jgi:PAS domain S-box-containing protein
VTILAKPFATAPIAIAVKKGNTALLRRIDQALLHLTADGTISEIEARWRPQEMLFFSRARVQTLILRTALITTGLLLIAMMIWVTTLRKQIGIRQCVEDRLRTLTEASFEGIAVCEDGVMVDANDQLVKMLGYERSELIGKPVSELIAPNSREFVHQAIKTGLSTPYEHDALRKDGSIFTVEVCGRNLTTDGRHLRVTAVRDVSERKRAEEALRRSEEKFARFFRSTPAATAVTVPSSGGMILDVNEEFTRLLGYSREEAVGRTTVELGIFANPEDRDRLLRLIQDKTELKQCELRLQARNGAIVIGQLSAQFTEIDGQRVLLAAFVDLTQRKEAEENLRASREQLRALTGRLQAVREEERTRIAREIHDVLAQELTRMKIDLGWLSKRLHQITKDPEQAGLFERLNSLNHLADHTISTVQKIAAELRPVALDSLGLSAAIEWQAEEFEARTGIRCDAIVPEQDFELDRNSATNLFRIVQESLTNIVRHAQATKVEIILELEADQLRLEIQDNGMGFDPRRLKDPHSLGLLGMRERALLLDGEFEISGDPGKGTRVSVTMPVHKRLHKVENFTSREEPVLS